MPPHVGFRREFLIVRGPVKIGGDLGKTLECSKPASGELDNILCLVHGENVYVDICL